MTDEIRSKRIGVESVSASCEASALKAPMSSCFDHGFNGAFLFPLVRGGQPLPYPRPKRKNRSSADPDRSAVPRGSTELSPRREDTDFLSAPLTLAKCRIFSKDLPGEKRKRSCDLIQNKFRQLKVLPL